MSVQPPLNLATILRFRSQLKAAIREFFASLDYLEVDTPVAVIAPGTEVHLRYFSTQWTDATEKSHQLYLRSSPEIHMKQIVSRDLPRVFQLATCFRSGGELSPWHHPEFTMLEWYQADLTFENFMDQTEALIRHCHESLAPETARLGLGRGLMLNRMHKIRVYDAFKEFVGIELVDQDPDLAVKAASCGVFSVNPNDDFATAYFKILIEKIEPHLERLNFCMLYDYPPSQAALATIKQGVAKRCEVYIGRIELANGFEELLEPEANVHRIRDANTQRQAFNYEVPELDNDFIQALQTTFVPCCGNALGLDRLLAIILDRKSLDDIIPFRRAMPYRGRIIR